VRNESYRHTPSSSQRTLRIDYGRESPTDPIERRRHATLFAKITGPDPTNHSLARARQPRSSAGSEVSLRSRQCAAANDHSPAFAVESPSRDRLKGRDCHLRSYPACSSANLTINPLRVAGRRGVRRPGGSVNSRCALDWVYGERC
jgi:hypothetical protein